MSTSSEDLKLIVILDCRKAIEKISNLIEETNFLNPKSVENLNDKINDEVKDLNGLFKKIEHSEEMKTYFLSN